MDVAIVFLSVVDIVLEELKSDMMPINPTIMRVMRVLRIARGTSFTPHYALVMQLSCSRTNTDRVTRQIQHPTNICPSRFALLNLVF